MAIVQNWNGSWGLPDFGITEKIGSFLGAPTTAQGGSNISAIGNPTAASLESKYTPDQIKAAQAGENLAYTTINRYSQNPSSSGSVLGATTGGGRGGGVLNTPTTSQSSSGNRITSSQALANGWDVNNLPSGYTLDTGGSNVDALAQQTRNDINAGFDAYTSQLDQMLGTLPSQQQGQVQMATNSSNLGLRDIESQKSASLADLATSSRKNSEQQVRSLADIADNIRNLFKTGNVMLGTRGAGDSSAADQYSYAVTKLGSKQRGDVLAQTRSIENDIADRAAKLNNIVTQETAKLKTNLDNQILQIAQYFQDKQNEILQAKANGQLQRGQSLASLSTQLLQVAQQQLAAAEQNHRTQQQSLLTWAENNAKTIGELKNNLAQISQYSVPNVQAGTMNGQATFDAQGNMSVPLFGGGGSYSTQKKDLYGNLNSGFSNNIG